MTKNPFINALMATAYISLVGLVPHFASKIPEPKDSLLGPIAFLSVFTLSASIMATLFFYQPIMLLIGGEKSHAFSFLIKTIGWFTLLTILILGALLAVQFS